MQLRRGVEVVEEDVGVAGAVRKIWGVARGVGGECCIVV